MGPAWTAEGPSAAPVAAFHPDGGSGHGVKPASTWVPSPNFASRQSTPIDTLVLHNTDAPLQSVIAHFIDPRSQVSAHYVVGRDGGLTQMVDDGDTAWHSGNKPMNQRSIGIEVEAWETATGMAAVQEAALVAIVKFVLETYLIDIQRVIPRRDVKPTDCPGWIWPTDGDFTAWTTATLTA